MALEVLPVAGRIGAEVRGPDLAVALDEQDRERLRQALDDHLVIFVHGQELDHAALKRATEIFGPLAPPQYVTPSAEDPEVIAVLKEADETDISVFGGDWHSDFSFLERPPGGSLLYAHEVPPYGGDTIWSSQIAAYEALDQEMKEWLDGRRVVHLGAPYGVAHAPPSDLKTSRSIAMTRGDPEADRERLHPAVRSHPRSGRKALFVNPTYTTRFEDMTVEESRPILERLYRHATRPDFTCRFRWSAGDLAIWDNRVTMHYAVNDYDGFRRLLYRTTFAGERPQ